MEEEDDLELLRLAALKSLNNKKENAPAPLSTTAKPLVNHPFKATAAIVPNSVIPIVNIVPGLRPGNEYYPIAPGVRHHPADEYIGSQFDKIDIKDQYVPQRVNVLASNGHYGSVAPEYVPYGSAPIASASNIPNVQLSPRSAAFVLQNNDILMKRKTGVSPGRPSSPRTRSPSPYRGSLGRWSATPPPMAKKHSSRSPKRSPYVYRRSASRSPIRRSPNRNRTVSRSPQRRNRRTSPPRSTFHRPPRSRSPPHVRHGISPTNYHQSRQWNHGANIRKSLSPRSNENTSNSNYRTSPKRRTRSPVNNKVEPRRRSASHSPARKYHRNGPPNRRRRSPPRKYNNNIRPRNPRSGYNSRRSTSPSNRRRSGSTTSPAQKNKFDEVPAPNNDDFQKQEQLNEKTENSEKIEKKTRKSDEPKAVSKLQDKPVGKTEQEIEDDLLASTDGEKNSDSDDNDDDGIDLFASEESESENEGRFKSSTSKTERTTTAATVSFSKLGTSEVTPAVALRDLDDLKSEKNTSYRKGESRDKDRSGRSGASKYSGRRNDRYGRKPRSNSRERNSTRGSSWKSSKDDSRKKDSEPDVKTENERKPIMFKSTFQVVDNEPKKIVTERGKKVAVKFSHALDGEWF